MMVFPRSNNPSSKTSLKGMNEMKAQSVRKLFSKLIAVSAFAVALGSVQAHAGTAYIMIAGGDEDATYDKIIVAGNSAVTETLVASSCPADSSRNCGCSSDWFASGNVMTYHTVAVAGANAKGLRIPYGALIDGSAGQTNGTVSNGSWTSLGACTLGGLLYNRYRVTK